MLEKQEGRDKIQVKDVTWFFFFIDDEIVLLKCGIINSLKMAIDYFYALLDM